MGKIIVRVKGGIGNQLFCYAAARRLALVNDAELVIDDVTGFVRDHQYQRKYMLDHFNIPARKATPVERLEPFERYRRWLLKLWSRRKPFAERRYLEQEEIDFDVRILDLTVKGTLYLDGYWQSENYFRDVEPSIRRDLRIKPPTDEMNLRMSRKICTGPAISLHVRWFDVPRNTATNNVGVNYYQRAIRLMEKKAESPHYFLFSDDPKAAQAKIALPEDRMTVVSHNRGDENAWADLWLMTQCQHFVISNSTFSWWGAWLANSKAKTVVAPAVQNSGISAWGFKGLIPDRWITL